MKNVYTITLCLLLSTVVHAQLDTSFLQTKVEVGHLENQQLVDAKRHYLQSQQEEKYLLKFGVEGMIFPLANSYFSFWESPKIFFIGYEYRLKTGFSINAQFNYSRTVFGINTQSIQLGGYSFVNHGYGFQIEPRWYLNKQKQVRNKKSGNNLNGIYTSLLFGAQYIERPTLVYFSSDGKKTFVKNNYQYGILNLGWQRRFGRNGFLHLQLGTGVQHIPQEINKESFEGWYRTITPLTRWQWLTTYKVGIGMAISGKNSTNKLENIWRYHQSDMDMWKVDLYGLLYGLTKKGLGGKLDIGYERSIRESPFSLAVNLIYFQYSTLVNLQQSSTLEKFTFNDLTIQVAPRYYYNLKK